MFVNFNPDWPPIPDPVAPQPDPTPRRREKRLMIVIGINVLLLFAAPIGGATLFGAIAAWWG